MSLIKLSHDINGWHKRTFGNLKFDCKRLSKKWAEESGELEDAIDDGDRAKAIEELADCQILLCVLAAKLNIDLEYEARKKFDIVQQRDQVARDAARGIE